MTDPAQPRDKDNRAAARRLMRACNRIALGTTLVGEGRAFVSMAAVATDLDGTPLLMLSSLSDHARNIEADGRVSLLFDGTQGFANPQEGPRATVLGRIEKVAGERVRRRYLARHPGAAMYANFADFAFWRVAIERIRWVGGFARAASIDAAPLVPAAIADAFAAAEPALIAKLNEGAEPGARRLVAVDPDGWDLARGKRVWRFAFERMLADPAEAAATLADLREKKTGRWHRPDE